MLLLDDIIAAPITALGGAVAGVRVSGPEAWKATRAVFPSLPDVPEPRKALYGMFAHGDDGLCLPFAFGMSYTGEESSELFVHGSPASVRLLMDRLFAEGVREARPGEFTQRAFLNGRLDLSQAEAVRETVEAESEAALLSAARQREGATQKAVADVTRRIERVLAEIEARVDFSEELGELDIPAARTELDATRSAILDLRQGARATRLAREGARIAILGRPNAGKSSLLNALIRRDRALVTPYAGTTRDTLEEAIEVEGLRLVLVDTAGLREAEDPVEKMGVRRSRQEAERADLIWYVVDASGETRKDTVPDGALVVANKIDLLPLHRRSETGTRGTPPNAEPPFIAVSAVTRAGLDALLKATLDRLAYVPPRVPVSDRHAQSLEAAQEAVEAARDSLHPHLPPDLAVTHLRETLWSLGEITGETADEGLLERIFAGFCVGK